MTKPLTATPLSCNKERDGTNTVLFRVQFNGDQLSKNLLVRTTKNHTMAIEYTLDNTTTPCSKKSWPNALIQAWLIYVNHGSISSADTIVFELTDTGTEYGYDLTQRSKIMLISRFTNYTQRFTDTSSFIHPIPTAVMPKVKTKPDSIINNIIFDLGGVILNLDYDLTINAFAKFGVRDFNKVYSQVKQSSLISDFETGKITAQNFRDQLRTQLDLEVSDEQFDAAWNAMLLDVPKERLELIKTLLTEYKVYLFSNTNEIHLKEGYRIIKRDTGLDNFNNYFDAQYFSYLFGKQKPHPESFTAILNENKLLAHETLFIDDTEQHILGAQAAGLHTLHLTKDKSIFDVLAVLRNVKLSPTAVTEELADDLGVLKI